MWNEILILSCKSYDPKIEIQRLDKKRRPHKNIGLVQEPCFALKFTTVSTGYNKKFTGSV